MRGKLPWYKWHPTNKFLSMLFMTYKICKTGNHGTEIRFRNNWETEGLCYFGNHTKDKKLSDWFILDVSGIIGKFNVYVTLAITSRTKEINNAFWLVHIFIKALSFSSLGRRIPLLYHVDWKNLALLQYHIYSGNIYSHQNTKFLFIREKNFTLIPCLLEEFGSSTTSHIFFQHLKPFMWFCRLLSFVDRSAKSTYQQNIVIRYTQIPSECIW